MRVVAITSTALFVLLIVFVVVGMARQRPSPPVTVDAALRSGKQSGTLYVTVHGLWTEGARVRWEAVEAVLQTHGDVLPIRYPAGRWSNADPEQIALLIKLRIDQEYRTGKYSRVVVVGNSMGALICRRARLTSFADGATGWAHRTDRLVLMAGMNRGWDLTGEKPADMHWYSHALATAGAWFARLTNSGRLLMGMEAGAPFVANLRLDWMRTMRFHDRLEIVQLLGDIDEIVSKEDNQDLRVMGSGDPARSRFVWLKVRGTGHADIADFIVGNRDGNLGQYRREKFEAAVTHRLCRLRKDSEELPYTVDPHVTEVVFVLHGIRDLGRWSARFEKEIKRQARIWGSGKVAIASSRYGYFGMGQFLLRADRERYVHWFMDQYTETLARYPNAERVHFVGHSNGTYPLGRALEKYRSLKIDNVVLAGSVMRRDYDWPALVASGRVGTVRNYVAVDDWVVALFPAFFEKPPIHWLGNDIGSAGFNGFTRLMKDQRVANVGYLKGQHSAFDQVIPDLVTDLLGPVPARALHAKQDASPVLQFASDYLVWLLWLFLASLVILVGSRVSVAAGELSLYALLAYVILVINVLRWV